MPKLSEEKIIIALLGFFAFWLFVVLPISYSYPSGVPTEATEFWTIAGYHLKITDALIAAFTGGLFVATCFLFNATKNLVRGAEQTAERQLRAYVMIDNAQIEGVRVGDIPSAKLIIKNSGQTPAYNVTHWCSVGYGAYPFTGIVPGGEDEDVALPPRPLAPGGLISTWADETRRLDAATMNALLYKSHAVYVVGQIRYEDAFGHRRETDFLLLAGGPIPPDGTLGCYYHGNRAT
jgi:hypothetical protein